MNKMNFPIRTKVKLTEDSYDDIDPGIDEDVYLEMIGTIIGYSDDAKYPYIIEFDKDDWNNSNTTYCKEAGCTLNYNGSIFQENEFFVIQLPLPSENSNYNMKENSEYAKQIAELDKIMNNKNIYPELDHPQPSFKDLKEDPIQTTVHRIVRKTRQFGFKPTFLKF